MAKDFGIGKTLKRTPVWRGSVGEFGEETVRLPDGPEIQLAILKHPGASAVVPFLSATEVVLLRQYRHAVQQTLWEVPAGKLDGDEDPRDCAVRELTEETGYVAGRMESMGTILTTPGFTDEVIHLFCAHELTPGPTSLESDERIETTTVPIREALTMIERGDIRDAKTICALHLAMRR